MSVVNDKIAEILTKADSLDTKIAAIRTAIEAYIEANPQANITGLQAALDKIVAAETSVDTILSTIPVT